MVKPVAIVDVFSGPGGLAEGFAACRAARGGRPYRVALSVEKDRAAYRTLMLRAFLRAFPRRFPQEYYDFLNGRRPEPDWAVLYPTKWRRAEHETLRLELSPGANDTLWPRIAEIRRRYGPRTVLVGGPPCQAYSLVGRARAAGNGDYAQRDRRLELYHEYVGVLRRLEPAAALMENVKGILSATVRGEPVFPKILEDIRNAGGKNNYSLFALTPSNDSINISEPQLHRDYVVRADGYGIPQNRHRVFVLCLRRDIARSLPDDLLPRLDPRDCVVSVQDTIGDMPRLRSGLSRQDTAAAWHEAIRRNLELVQDNRPNLPGAEQLHFDRVLRETMDAVCSESRLDREAQGGTELHSCRSPDLRKWIHDDKLDRLPNNETRGHMPSDLARYLFAAIFARAVGRSPKASDFPAALAPAHKNWNTGKFADRYRVQLAGRPSSTITSHIAKDGHYFIHHDASQCRSLTVREAARLQTFPDNYLFKGNRTEQYVQVGNAVPPFLAYRIAQSLWRVFEHRDRVPQYCGSAPRIDRGLQVAA